MNVMSKVLDDGQISVTFTGTMEELEHEFLAGAEELDEKGEAEGEDFLRKAYCCTCSSGEKHDLQATHSRSAFFKCLKECGAGFSLRHGTCA